MTWVLLAVAIVTEVVGTLALRASDGMRKPRWLVVTAIAYLAAFSLVAAVLARDVPVGVVYGIWVALGVALATVGGAVVFGDRLTRTMVGGIGLIVVGVLLIELGAHP